MKVKMCKISASGISPVSSRSSPSTWQDMATHWLVLRPVLKATFGHLKLIPGYLRTRYHPFLRQNPWHGMSSCLLPWPIQRGMLLQTRSSGCETHGLLQRHEFTMRNLANICAGLSIAYHHLPRTCRIVRFTFELELAGDGNCSLFISELQN